MKIIAGIGGNNTARCHELARRAEDRGADALLMSTPYYNKTSQSGLVEHFSYVADRAGIPLILYNIPSRTSIGISPQVYRELAKHPNINGVKEASGDLSLIMDVACTCGGELNIWSGNDDNTVAMMAVGAMGVISVLSNIFPRETARLCALCAEGSFSDAMELYKSFSRLVHLLFCETNPIPVKAALRYLDMDSGLLRLPLVDISRENRAKLEAELERLGA